MRKTIEADYILEKGNYFLEHSEPEQAEQRKGVASMIELVLHETGRYKGFGYLDSANVQHKAWREAWDRYNAIAEIAKANDLPGYANLTPRWEDFCEDDTRRVYYAYRR